MNDPLPVDLAMALDHSSRFVWDDEYAQHVASLDETQKLIELRHGITGFLLIPGWTLALIAGVLLAVFA